VDWSNERYVRLYTRDTGDWVALSWEARSLFVLLLRKVDRAGVLQCRKGAAQLAGVVTMPREVVERALVELIDDGCVRPCEDGFLLPNFLEAQEAPMSNAQRARESRASRRDRAAGRPVTKRDDKHSATKRDTTVTNGDSTPVAVVTVERSATKRDAGVTNGVKNVTPTLPKPTLPVPTQRDGGGEVDPRIRLVVAANRAIAERLGVDEQPVGINANTGHAFEAADAILKEHGVPLEFAEYAISEVARTANWDKPPRSLKYFVDAIVRRWQAGDQGAVSEVRESSAAGGSDLRERAEWLRREVFSTGIHAWYQHQFEDLFAQSREQMADPERLRREWALYGREIKRILDRHPKEGEFLPALIKLLAQHSSGEAREVAAR
jgi:hypothetical protein